MISYHRRKTFRCVFSQGGLDETGVDEQAGIVPGDRQVHLLPSVPGDQVPSGDCQVQEGGDQVPPGGAEAGKQLEGGKDSLATGWIG